ncbi:MULTISPECIES: hypothetical protein [Streptomyces]|uniref:hypothetical protein n=1 Tax=Streptomyces TaxID=1883 RepID=UPI0033BC36CD
MSEPRDRSGPEASRGAQDPLRSLFRQAGDFGQGRVVPEPATYITERGMRAQRRRMAAVAVGVCLVIGGGGAAAVGLLPVTPKPAPPATSPSPSYPSPAPPPPAGTPTEPPTPSNTVPGSEGAVTGTTAPGGPPTTEAPTSASSTSTSTSTSTVGATSMP